MFCWYYYSDYFFRVPLTTYFLLAILTIATMGLSNTSLGYLNYPTQVIFKSSKLIPVMIGGVFIQGKFLIFFFITLYMVLILYIFLEVLYIYGVLLFDCY